MNKHVHYALMGIVLLLIVFPIALWTLFAEDEYITHEAASSVSTISGSFTIINPARPVTAELRQNTAGGPLISTINIPITAANVSTPATFTFSNVAAGTYSLVFRQLGHTTFTINGIAVAAGSNIDISRDPNFPRQLPLRPGDVNGDGQINVTDLIMFLQNWLTNYASANFTGSGQVNVADLSLLLQNWMAQSVVVQATPVQMPTPTPPSPAPTPTPPTPTPTPTPPTPQPPPTPPPQMTIPNRRLTPLERDQWVANYHARGGVNALELELLHLINMERINAGIAPLAANPALMLGARFEAQSMLDLDYFLPPIHPHYGAFPGVPRALFGFNVSLLGGALNVARWEPQPQSIVQTWMNNRDQRANILNPGFVETGVGVISAGTGAGSFSNLWVMTFVETDAGTVNPPDVPQSEIQIPNRRLTQAEINRWIDEYRAMGGVNELEHEVLRLTNIERARFDLAPLSLNPTLMMVARFKAQGMTDLNYFSHINPVYGTFTNMPRELFNIYVMSENLAIWYRTPQDVVAAWMISPGHRAAILNPDHTELGVGFHRDRWAQSFR
ncbi:MAG: CAP domain-containing protein [Defluviitaleaceae bacterium]|nr:CAP domain-containing protein [Defluviitaleaceae bacterium]